MPDLSKKQIDMFVRAMMPELYKAQERWDAWYEALDEIADKSVKLEDLEKPADTKEQRHSTEGLAD